MKKVEQAEDSADLSYVLGHEGHGPLATGSGMTSLLDKGVETVALDSFVTGLKWAFIYLPAAILIHGGVMTSMLLLWQGSSPAGVLLEGIGTLIVAAFLVMFGIGKLRDLKYLRVVGTILAVSHVFAVLSVVAGLSMPSGSFQWVFFCTMPLTALAGYLAKRSTDDDKKSLAESRS